MNNFFDWYKKYHDVEFDVPPVKFFGLTIRRGYTVIKIVDCAIGKSCRERLIEGANKPNVLLRDYCGVK